MKFIKRCESSGDDGKNEANEPRLCWRCRYGTALDKQNIPAKNFFLPINFRICFGCTKELSH